MGNIRIYLRAKLVRALISFWFLSLASISSAQGIIELSINGAPLAGKTVIDYIDNNREYTTDSMGRLKTEGSCPAIQYTDNSGIEFRMLQFCGVSSEVPVYKFELAEAVTLSGRIEIDQLCLCGTRFVNLETGRFVPPCTSANTAPFLYKQVSAPEERSRVKGSGSITESVVSETQF